MMENKELYGFVLLMILVGFIIGVGVLAIDKFGAATTTTETSMNETFAGVNGSAVALANNELVAVSAVRFANNSVAISSSHYSVDLPAGTVTVTNGTRSYAVDYTFTTDTPTSDVADSIGLEIGAIATTWFGLIITIFVLAIIITMVVKSFGFQGRR